MMEVHVLTKECKSHALISSQLSISSQFLISIMQIKEINSSATINLLMVNEDHDQISFFILIYIFFYIGNIRNKEDL